MPTAAALVHRRSRLVHRIEAHSQELAGELLKCARQSPHLTSFGKVPDHELRQRVHEIYGHLGQWLMNRTEGDIARQYAESACAVIVKECF